MESLPVCLQPGLDGDGEGQGSGTVLARVPQQKSSKNPSEDKPRAAVYDLSFEMTLIERNPLAKPRSVLAVFLTWVHEHHAFILRQIGALFLVEGPVNHHHF